jgi:type III pantothenate kinase
MLLCIDIGNTHTHVGLLPTGGREPAQNSLDLPTGDLGELPAALRSLGGIKPDGIAFCSVVPDAVPRLHAAVAGLELPIWQLTHEADLGLAITYPRPEEIGQDRLANAAGAVVFGPPPAIVIDLGTAVTFDIITRAGGYEGGIITAGPALMTRYLHERTAQLPLVEDVVTPVDSPIGKSTREALRIGAVLGFTGSIQACLDAVIAELAERGETDPRILTAGGAAELVSGRLRQSTTDLPDLALRGLASAWERTAR